MSSDNQKGEVKQRAQQATVASNLQACLLCNQQECVSLPSKGACLAVHLHMIRLTSLLAACTASDVAC